MKVNKSSWHYRWLLWWSITLPAFMEMRPWDRSLEFQRYAGEKVFKAKQRVWEPQTLCRYVHLLWARPLFVAVTMLPAYAVLMILTGLWGVLLVLAKAVWWPIRRILSPIPMPKRREKREKVAKEPGIVRTYIRARHDNICPMLTFDE